MIKIFRQYYLFFIASIAALTALLLELTGFHQAGHWVLGIAAAVELLPLLWRMIQDLRIGTYGVDILAATAIITSLAMGEYWAGMVIVLMLTGGEALEDYAEHRAERELDALLKRAPQKAHVMRGGREITIKASEVVAGDRIIIRPGELTPVDATVLDGVASFDESSLTGESMPVVKQKGSELLSGTINLDGSITAVASRAAADSQYQQIIKLVKAAQASQAPFVRLADHYAIPFTVVSFGIAVAAWVISGDSLRFLQVIVVATPCPLILAAPIAIISGMSRSAKHGIIIKTGSSLEKLARVKTIAFDKTGTLTRGELKVDNIKTFNKFTAADVLAIAASLEQHSNHALSAPILERAKRTGAEMLKVKQVHEIAGRGITGTYKSQALIVGRLQLLEEHDVALPKTFNVNNFDQTAGYVAMDGKLAGVITFSDEIRPETKSTLQQLRSLGVAKFLMVTGDNERTAKHIAGSLGIKDVVAMALPGDKIRAIENIKARPVGFVGDGVNDAPVLTASDVGIALGARGSAAASESADVVIMQDDLSRVAKSIEIAKRTFLIARQSIWVGIGLSVGLMLVFSTGKFKPIYGAAIQEVVDVVVIFNALRAHTSGRPAKQK